MYDYFSSCYQLTNTLTEDDVISLDPTSYDIKLSALQTSYSNMISESVPETLILNPKCNIIDFDDHTCFFYIKRLIKLPIIMKQIIEEFNGSQTVDQLLTIIPDKYNVDIDMAYIRHLHEQEILIQHS